MIWDELNGKAITKMNPSDLNHLLTTGNNECVFPIVSVYCDNVKEIKDALMWAKKYNFQIAVTTDDLDLNKCCAYPTLYINVSQMNKVIVDTTKEIITVEPGAKLNDIYSSLQNDNYIFPGTNCLNIDISKLLYSGGLGLSARYIGLTSDSLVNITMINYLGELINININEHDDLFWALKGICGHGFGVIVSYSFKLKYQRGVTIFKLEWPKENRIIVFKELQQLIKNLDSRITFKADFDKNSVIITGFFYGKLKELQKFTKTLFKISDLTSSYIDKVSFFEAVNLFDCCSFFDENTKQLATFVFEDFTETTITNILKTIDNAPETLSLSISLLAMGGQILNIDVFDSSYFYRDAKYLVQLSTNNLVDCENNEIVRNEYLLQLFKQLESFTKGSIGEIELRENWDYNKEFFGQFYWKINNIKEKYDPLYIFSFPYQKN